MALAGYVEISSCKFVRTNLTTSATDTFVYSVGAMKVAVDVAGSDYELIDGEEEQFIDWFKLDMAIALGAYLQQDDDASDFDFGVGDLLNALKNTNYKVEFYPAFETDSGDFSSDGYEVNLGKRKLNLFEAKSAGLVDSYQVVQLRTKSPLTTLPQWCNF